MPRLADEMKILIKCPKCGHETEHSIAGLKDDPVLVCLSCGERFRVESKGTMRETADKLDDLDRAWDKVTKG
jgi:transcription elongation factor Elf1